MRKIVLFTVIIVALLQSCSTSEDIDNMSLVATSEKQQKSLNTIKRSNRNSDVQDIYSYSKGIYNLSNNSSVMYVSNTTLTDMTTSKLPVVIVMHGWLGSKEKMAWIGKLLAKKGFASLVVTGGNYKNFFTNPRDWQKNYSDAVKSILIETQRKNSPLYNRLDTKKISLIGHSMGGGGAFFFADNAGFNIKSIVALAPYCLEIRKPGTKTICPTMVIAGKRDILATPHMTKDIYKTVKATSREYKLYKKVAHNDFEKGGNYHREIGNDIVFWLSKHGK